MEKGVIVKTKVLCKRVGQVIGNWSRAKLGVVNGLRYLRNVINTINRQFLRPGGRKSEVWQDWSRFRNATGSRHVPRRLGARIMKALSAAELYLWHYLPIKVYMLSLSNAPGDLRGGERFAAFFQQLVWPHERKLLRQLRLTSAATEFSGSGHAIQGHAPHEYCHNGYWFAAAWADCAGGLAQDNISSDKLAELCALPASIDEYLAEMLLLQTFSGQGCLAEVAQCDHVCGLSKLKTGRLLESLIHFQILALELLLCDGCRVDGLGLYSAALDEVLQTFATMAMETCAGQGPGRRSQFAWDEAAGVELASDPAARANASPRLTFTADGAGRLAPPSLWRGDAEDATLFGRTAGCPLVLRPHVCYADGELLSSDPEAPLMLPTCHYERQRAEARGLPLGSLGRSPKYLHACGMAPSGHVLLVLPVYPPQAQHLTSVFAWLLPALSWFHGTSGPKLLAALRREAGIPVPPRLLEASRTDVLLAPVPSWPLDPATILGSVFFSLLSTRPVQVLPSANPCRCYRGGAVWGHPEPPFGAPGDLLEADGRALRASLLARFPGPTPVLLRRWAPAWRTPGRRVRLLLVRRLPQEARRITNAAALATALRTGPLARELAVAHLTLQRLPFLSQLHAALRQAQVLVAAFGAALAWTPLLPRGAHVVQLHPPADTAPHFGSCFATGGPEGGAWGANPRSEWGAWAKAWGLHHACVTSPPTTESRCGWALTARVRQWDVPNFSVAVERTTRLVADAVRRIKGNNS